MAFDPEHEFFDTSQHVAMKVAAWRLRDAAMWYDGFGGSYPFTGWQDDVRTEVVELLLRLALVAEDDPERLLDLVRFK